jgi:hypothetical protein
LLQPLSFYVPLLAPLPCRYLPVCFPPAYPGLPLPACLLPASSPTLRPLTHSPLFGYWGIVINKRRLNKVTLNKVSTRQHVKHLRRFCSTIAV